MADNLLATQLRKGMIVKIDKELYRIFGCQHVTPGNLRGFVRVKMRNIRTGSMAEEKLRSEDIVERISLEQKAMQYLYNDNEGYHFMDTVGRERVRLLLMFSFNENRFDIESPQSHSFHADVSLAH